jgi:GntR family transcriptional repressor for pyruvate dehydrogenase complex
MNIFVLKRRRTLDKKLTYESVYDEIRQRIKNGIWKTDEKIPTIEEISREFGVGVSSVREAIRILGKQGILKVQQGRGTFVGKDLESSPSDRFDFLENATFLQLTEARLIIEPELAALAAEKADSKDKKAIVKAAQTMKGKVQTGEDFLKEDIEFHQLISRASENEILYQMLNMMSDLLLDSRRKTMKWKGMDEKASSFHLLIAHAINESKPEQARLFMKNHIEDMLSQQKESSGIMSRR